MATTIFSWSDSDGEKSGSSSGGAEVKLSRSSGEAIPSNATIISVSWYARAGCGKAGSSSQWSFNRFKVDGVDTYPSLSSKSGESGSSSKYWRFYGTSSNYSLFQGKSSLECTFGISNSVGDGSWTSFLYAAEVTVTWEKSYEWNYGPSNLSITQNNDGTFNASWSAASWQGPGSIWYYMTSSVATGTSWIWNGGTTTANNVSIPAYGSQITITITAEEQDSWSGKQTSTTYTFKAPTLSAPSISLSATSGQSVTITRGDSTVNKGSATSITYDLYQGSSKVGTFSGKTYSINQATLESWKQTTITFKVRATASGVKPVVNNKSTLTADSGTVTFTFEPYNTICYYDGSNQVECIVYYYDGSSWQECEPYYYDGSNWQLCSYT